MPHVLSKSAIVAVSAVLLSAIAGCAASVDAPEERDTAAPAGEEPVASESQALTGPCTTSTSCDKNYCCTTVNCRFVTTVTCTPRAKALALP